MYKRIKHVADKFRELSKHVEEYDFNQLNRMVLDRFRMSDYLIQDLCHQQAANSFNAFDNLAQSHDKYLETYNSLCEWIKNTCKQITVRGIHFSLFPRRQLYMKIKC